MGKRTTLRDLLPEVAGVTWEQIEGIADRRGHTVEHTVMLALGVYALRHGGKD